MDVFLKSQAGDQLSRSGAASYVDKGSAQDVWVQNMSQSGLLDAALGKTAYHLNVSTDKENVTRGDTVAVRAGKQKKAYMEKIKEKLKNFQTLDWISLNPNEMSGKVLSSPVIEGLGTEINTQLIVEHYSRT